MSDHRFREDQPLAWTFHRNTSRWAFNTLEPETARAPDPPKEHLDAPLLPLPPPVPLAASLDAALAARFSCRSFADEPLAADRLATVLHAGYGVRATATLGALEMLERPVPSGGGLYPLELYVLARRVAGVPAGIYHYAAPDHALERLRDVALPRPLSTYLFMGQPYASEAAAIVVITAVLARSLWKYADRGYRYLLIEAGHVGQNVNLSAAALGLGSCNFGGFFDDELAGMLRVDVEEELPLYGIALGDPAEGDRAQLRLVPD